MPPRPQPKVFIVSWCRSAEQLYGATLVFDSLRTGFPDTEITLIENASPPELRGPILAAAARADCRVQLLEEEHRHPTILRRVVMAEDAPLVFVDPDVVFWEKVSDWDFGAALMAGRYLPEFDDPYSRTLTLSRLHTSHLWFPRPGALRARIAEIAAHRWEIGDVFEPSMRPPGWWRWDTTGVLFHALGAEAVAFSDAQLDCYDHLFCGSHLDYVLPHVDAAAREVLTGSHALARSNVSALRGVWRQQQAFFSSRPWGGIHPQPPGRGPGVQDGGDPTP